MIHEYTKIFLHRNIVTVTTDINMKPSVILAETLEWLFSNRFGKNKDILDSTLFITDSLSNNTNVTLSRKDFPYIVDGEPHLIDYFPYDDNEHTILGISIGHFLNLEKMGDMFNLLSPQKYKVIILGFINNIPDTILNNIFKLYSNSLIVVFGDEVLGSINNDPMHLRFLTNCNLKLTSDRSDDRVSPNKKISAAIAQMRKPTSKFGDIQSASIVVDVKHTLDETNFKDIMDTESTLKVEGEKYQIIVPHRLYNDIMSDVHNSIYGVEEIAIRMFRDYYNKLPLIHTNPDGSTHFIPPLTKMNVLNIKMAGFKDGDSMLICDIICDYVDGVKDIKLIDVAINYSAYARSFNPEKHVFTHEVPNTLLEKWSPDILYLIPFPIITYEFAKLTCVDRTYGFIETINTFNNYKPATDVYPYFCRTTKGINIVQSDLFDYL